MGNAGGFEKTDMAVTGGLGGEELAEHTAKQARQDLKAMRRRVTEIWIDMVAYADDIDDEIDATNAIRSFADDLLDAIRGRA